MTTGSGLYDAIVAASLFGSNVIGLVVLIRQSRNTARQSLMHVQNQVAIADLKETIVEVHKP